ncbi:solute carrier family 35 member F2 isoform X3 [Hippopotamus amphibius kiboko]|uniref:solute carrier family 35 member F2 isoform X3 n=1 Tax=Hippopotamus amphibius kiboko TaxID=575201 RepID=UPI002594EC22|nr:solute carrier family 35 member F2 isoform X3 [Hippopotamus amphibius kiboko]
MEAASPAGPGGPQPHAPGVVGASFSLLRRIRGKLFTCDNLFYILKKKWWKYILLGLADVEANYLIVRAYQYTTLTSVQLLDCFGIPVLMALSWFILYARYRVVHFIAVAVCLLGVGTMVGADILAGREDNSGSNVLIGDILVLLGASLYAVSNVCEEYIVKKLSRQEFLGMVGLFGTIISGIQLLIVEYKDIASIQWDWKVALLFVAFALCMFCLYSFMPLVIKVTSATSVNLGILTADLYSLFFGLFLFGYKILDPKIKPSHLLDKNFFGHSLQANSIFQDSTSCPSLSSWWGSFCTAPPRRAQQSWLKAACHQSPALESTTWD